MAKQKINRAAARRAATAAQNRFVPRDLPPELQQLLDDYIPKDIESDTWTAIRPTVVDVMRRTDTTGAEKFRKQRGWVTQLAAWSHANGLTLGLDELLTTGRIHGFTSRSLTSDSDSSRATKRSKLLEVARQANPAFDGPPRGQQISRPRIKPPYSDRHVAEIVWIAKTQPTASRQRQLCAVVGLGLGAGLDSTDLKSLHARAITSHGTDGLQVEVGGARPRTVVIDPEFVELVRAGIAGLRPGELVIGKKSDRRNIAARVIEQAEIGGNAPKIEQGRLRATWLAHKISQPLPLLTILDAAGLRSVQTLVDIARFLLEQEDGR